jgi:hypothetical protein
MVEPGTYDMLSFVTGIACAIPESLAVWFAFSMNKKYRKTLRRRRM